MNFTEKQIQEHIWKFRDDLHELIDEFEKPLLYEFGVDEKSIEEVTAEKILNNLIVNRIADLHEDVRSVFLFGNEISLGNDGETKIRADFLGKGEGRPGIYIFELKKDGQTERQAFTELLAYANQLNYKFPSHCTDDTIFVLISPIKSKTIEDAYLQSLVFDRRKVSILQPYFTDETNIETLRLKPFFPSLEDILIFSNAAFKKRNFDVAVFVWSDDESHWNPKPEGQNEQDMNRVASIAAQLMEAKNIHGFVYGQQTHPELKEILPYTNKLVLVGLNPYKIASDNYYRENSPEAKINELPYIFDMDEHTNLTHILKGLAKHKDIHEEWNYFTNLANNWSSQLYYAAKEAVDFGTINRVGVRIHTEIAYAGYWEQYESSFIENATTFNYEIKTTGILRQLYHETMRLDYLHWSKFNSHPFQGDAFGWAIENCESHYLFEIFLNRMFYGEADEESYGGLEDSDETD